MIEFHQGKIIRYTDDLWPSPVNLKNIRKVTFTPERQPKTMGGDKTRRLPSIRSIRIWATALDIRLFLAQWQKCKLDYSAREKEYILRCK